MKICCISDISEGRLAIEHGADALGLVSHMPSGPGVISDQWIARIAATVPPGVASFLLTCLQSADAIIDQQRKLKVNTIQLCDSLPHSEYALLRQALPGVKLVQVIHVTGENAIAEASQIDSFVDGILLDSGNPALAVKELGGTGRRHDWTISRRIRDAVAAPVYLAGGLCAENVAEAMATVQPFGLDVCSGVRTDGQLDETKLAAFFEAVHAAVPSANLSPERMSERLS